MTVAGTEELSQWIERFGSERRDLPPVELLKGEHRIIRGVLDALESESRQLAAGKPVDRGFWLRVVDFVQHFIDRCHHQKEEEVLFPLLLGRARSERVGPIVAMKHEHVEGRELKNSLCRAANASDPEILVAAATTYTRLLREHMATEEQGAFEMDRKVRAGQAERMHEEFTRVERETLGTGGYDRYLELAREICRRAGGTGEGEGKA